MAEKILEFLSKIFDKLLDKTVRHKLCFIFSLSGLFIYGASKNLISAYVAVVAILTFLVDVIYDRTSQFLWKYRTSGKRALRCLDHLDDECKRIVRDIYNSDNQSVKILDSNGAKMVLITYHMVMRCSTVTRSDGRDFSFCYCLQPWVRRYIDAHPEWLKTVPKGKSKAIKHANDYNEY